MSLIQRLQIALDSPMGLFFLGLSALVVTLGILYWIFALRQRQQNRFRYEHEQYLAKARAQLLGYQIKKGSAQLTLYGEESIVKDEKGEYFNCVIPYPDLFQRDCVARFGMVYRALSSAAIPHLAPLSSFHSNGAWVFLQKERIDKEGQRRLTLHEYIWDHKPKTTESERFLLSLAQTLAELHAHKSERGEGLYHGLLLPHTLCLHFDAQRAFHRLFLAYQGFAFALGPQGLWEHLQSLQKSSPQLGPLHREVLQHDIQHLAPEQRDARLWHRVGPAVDFYAFACLAIRLFCPSASLSLPPWEKIPSTWTPFLQACLQKDPERRPKDFLEIHDRLEDPELSLSGQQVVSLTPYADISQDAPDLESVLQEMQEETKSQARELKSETFSKMFQEGRKAIQQKQWEKAVPSLLEAHRVAPEDSETMVLLAIAFYELNDQEKAQEFYERAKKRSPQSAKAFRQYIAFRV